MLISVRAAHLQDAAAVEEVLTCSYPKLMRRAYDPDLLARALPRITRPDLKLLGSGTYMLAEARGQPVGCGGWSLVAPGTTDSQPGIAHIRHFATLPEWAGCGIGRLIYDRCEQQARAAGVQLFECHSSLNGEPFYAALGFHRVCLIDVDMGPDLRFPSVRMLRSI